MRTIAIMNLKGGVAKTVTAVNLAANLATLHEKRVLVIDADSQANSTEPHTSAACDGRAKRSGCNARGGRRRGAAPSVRFVRFTRIDLLAG